LSLDRQTVSALIEAALADPVQLRLPGLGMVTVRIGRPRSLAFHDGGIEATLPLFWVESSIRTAIDVRFVPKVDRLYGQVRLECESARPTETLPFPIDLASLLQPMALPQRLDWKVELQPDVELWADCFVQGVEIREERLVLLLGVALSRGVRVSAPDRPPVSSAPPTP
jgi:hypothetical protein